MRRWMWLVLVVGLLLIAAAWMGARKGKTLDDESPTAEALPRPPSVPDDPAATAAGSTVSTVPPVKPQRLISTDEDIINRQIPVPGKLADVLAELVPRAEQGDAEAAYQLFIKINDCKWAIEGVSSAHPTTDKAAQAVEKAWLTDTLTRLENCEGITDELIDSLAKWLTLAADGGDPLAQLTYASSSDLIVGGASQMLANPRAVEDYKTKSLRFLTTLAERGDVSAILHLSIAYGAGVLVPRDPIKAYAYAYLANLIGSNNSAIVQALGAHLTPEQLQQGQQMAISLHRRCCG